MNTLDTILEDLGIKDNVPTQIEQSVLDIVQQLDSVLNHTHVSVAAFSDENDITLVVHSRCTKRQTSIEFKSNKTYTVQQIDENMQVLLSDGELPIIDYSNILAALTWVLSL